VGERAAGVIADSPSLPRRELTEAVVLARSIGARLEVIGTREMDDERYRANAGDRCYFCKSELFVKVRAVADQMHLRHVVHGAILDDLGDYRPGIAAARERNVRSPLIEALIGKPEVRALAQALGLPVWDKPAMACLSSRVPHGTPITPELLRQIEGAEDALVELGFRQFRVRHHGEIARLELPVEEFPLAMEQHGAIVAGVTAAGYRFVTLDLAGFRSGSLNSANGAGSSVAVISLAELTAGIAVDSTPA